MPRSRPPEAPPVNRLLAALPPAEYARLRPHLRSVRLDLRQVIQRPGQPIGHVYFPTTAVVCPLMVMASGAAIEVGAVGNEGVAGVPAALGVPTSPYQTIVQVAGEALRMEAAALARACDPDGPVRHVLFRYYAFFLYQVSQSAACNGLHPVHQRCCRWLLVARDRVGRDELPLTHEFLAMMLGVRRVSVTLLLQPLQDRGLVRTGRGRITVLDRPGLEAAACECYRRISDQYERLLGPRV